MNRVQFGDCRDTMRAWAAAGVKAQMCVTSPPYFGLRDYGHPGQIGLEQTPEQYVAAMVEVFRCVKDVLADDGTLWLNIGDSYAGYHGNKNAAYDAAPSNKGGYFENQRKTLVNHNGIKNKDLIGIPWMLAFALRADGWFLRQDIIWHKPNPMPESVRDRCTKAHEYLFLLSKSERYYFDSEAMQEPAINVGKRVSLGEKSFSKGQAAGAGIAASGNGLADFYDVGETRNRRSVWTVATRPYKGAHFATFPPALIEPCILAGSRTAGKRCDCNELIYSPTGTGEINDPSMDVGRAGMSRPRRDNEGTRPITRLEQRHHAAQMKASSHKDEMAVICGTAFAHYTRTDASGARPLPESIRAKFMANGWITSPGSCNCPIQPADVVLDPFMGSGTTAQVALQHGRQYLGCELNPAYQPLQDARIATSVGPLFA